MNELISTTSESSDTAVLRAGMAVLLAQALTDLYPNAILGGPLCVDGGFGCDVDLRGETIDAKALKAIENRMRNLLKSVDLLKSEKLLLDEAEFLLQGEIWTYRREALVEMRARGVKNVWLCSVCDKSGTTRFRDICDAAVDVSTRALFHFKLRRASGAYRKRAGFAFMIQRIEGFGFATEEALKSYIEQIENAERRDHVAVGRALDYYCISDVVGQGLPLLTPKGTRIMSIFKRFIEDEEEKRGYQQTCTPIMARSDLYKISGHWNLYRDHMFVLDVDGEEMALRPMTCPFQFVLYNRKVRSYRDLPIRYSETSTLFRNEQSGAMHGLVRMRQFTLADGHIICRHDQLGGEFAKAVDLMRFVVDSLGLKGYWFRLSKWDPNSKAKYVDNVSAWESSQAELKRMLDQQGVEYVEADGEAAFYGPKLDLQMRNVYGKEDTIITIQIDFALPERFDMSYVDAAGEKKRPIVIHRSSIGCYERTFAFLLEQCGGALPLWLSPVQCVVLSVADKFVDFARRVHDQIVLSGVRSQLDDSDERLGKKIRNAESQRIPYMLVVGEEEETNGTVAVRRRGQSKQESLPLSSFVAEIVEATKRKA